MILNKSILDKSSSVISTIDFKCNKQADVDDAWVSEYAPITMFSINGPLIWADLSTIGAFLIKRQPIVFQGVDLFTNFGHEAGYYIKKLIPIEDVHYRYKFWVYPIINASVPINNLSAYESGWALKYLKYFDNKYTKYYTNAFYQWLNNNLDITLANHSRVINYGLRFAPGYIWFNYGQGNTEVSSIWVELTNLASEAAQLIEGALDVVEIYKKVVPNIPVPTRIAKKIQPRHPSDFPVVNNMEDLKQVVNLSKYEKVQETLVTEVKNKTGFDLFKDVLTNVAFELALDYILGSFCGTYGFPAWVIMDNVQLNTKDNYNAEVIGLHEDIVRQINLPSNSDIGLEGVWLNRESYFGMRTALESINMGKTYDGSIFTTSASLDGSKINIKTEMNSILTGGQNGLNQVIEPFKVYINVNGQYANLVVVGVEPYNG